MDKLSPHIIDHYVLKGIEPGEVIFRGQRYDFRRITLPEADTLCQAGYKRLVKKKKPASKKATGKED